MSAPDHPDQLHQRIMGDVAASLPGATSVFDRFDLDYCCNGERSLAEVADEEQTLFPAMRANDAPTVTDVIAALADQRATCPAHLHEIEELANGFALPSGACRTWQTLYFEAARFLDEFRYHAHLENNVLFPRFTRRSPPTSRA